MPPRLHECCGRASRLNVADAEDPLLPRLLLLAQLPLIPQPRELAIRPDLALTRGVTILTTQSDDRFAAQDLRDALTERGIRLVAPGSVGAVGVTLGRLGTPLARRVLSSAGAAWDSAMTAEGYVLVADSGRVTVVGASAAGVFYGVQTLKQLIAGAVVHGAVIRDWPALRWRGVQDDVSRGPVPTLGYQKRQIRTLAAYKLNVFSLYFEHTLAYASDPLIAPPGGALTPDDVGALVAYAAQYHVTIVPEQEAFGHLHHVLKHERYAGLGETPHGHVLAPGDSGSLPLITGWFRTIDSLFPGPFVHIGADETFELGRGRTKPLVDSLGLGPVYLDFLARIATALHPAGRRLLFWGDVAVTSPDQVKALPHDLVAVAWNYWSRDGFDPLLKPFLDAGLETWVAPGVNGWNRVFPDYATALPNIQGFTAAGQRLGSTGVLNTSWDDDGEALFEPNWYGVLFGAGASWQPGTADIAEFQRRFGAAFCGDTSGAVDEAERRVLAAHALLDSVGLGGATDDLFWLDPWSPRGQTAAEVMRAVAPRLRLLAEDAIELVARARPRATRNLETLDAVELGARKIDFIGMKFQLADEVARLYALARDPVPPATPPDYLTEITSMNGRLQDLRDGYTLLRDLYEAAWHRENRPYWLGNVLSRYDAATRLWLGRIDRFNDVLAQWWSTKQLPKPEELGLPSR